MKVIEVLASCKQGLTRKQIAEKIKTASGGSLTKVIKELVNCDFVRGYNTRERRCRASETG